MLALRVGYEKLQRETGWEPRVSWEEGIARTIAWYASDRERWSGRVDWLGRRGHQDVTEPTFDVSPCPVCEADDAIVVHRIVYGSDGVLESLQISERPRAMLLRCCRCGHHFARPQITAVALASYYSGLGSELFTEPGNDAAEVARARFLVGAIERWTQGGRILDVGCGRGELLREFDPLRWERIGIEPFPIVDVEETASAGVTVVRGLLDDVSLPESSFDVVVAIDLLEHLRGARTFAHRVRSLVRDEGLVVVVTGDISSFFARLFGARWGYFGSWEHVSFFTPSSIQYLFKNAGFTVVENRRISHDQRIRGIHSFFVLAAPIAAKNIVKRALNLARPSHPYKIRAYPLLFDHMLVVARATHEPSPAQP